MTVIQKLFPSFTTFLNHVLKFWQIKFLNVCNIFNLTCYQFSKNFHLSIYTPPQPLLKSNQLNQIHLASI